MKKIVLSLAIILCGIVANAQEFKPFRVGIGLGYTMPSDGGGGVLFDIEPSYRLSDEIALGLRIESAAMARAIGEDEGSVSGNGSYTLNGQYYLSNNKFRPYVGLGVGLYSLASVSISGTSGEIASESKIGFYPRVGFDLGHFNLNLDYNLISATEESFDFGNGNTVETDIKNSYLGIRIGAFIGGGRN
ncbi:hypothetical protein E1176_00560, partial [Fulvivirga sp. RKSG066]|uniref:outer membrane beta-barrel protein n=1 Tax=Fulvivirga aurantia TaxID=2529383 RepID=UPI0012BB9F20